MPDPHGRPVGYVEDLDGTRIYVGVEDGTVTIHAGVYVPGSGIRLGSAAAADFARLYVSGCWQASAQACRTLTGAELAELRAAAEEMCLADCGAQEHDESCSPQPERDTTR